MTAELCDCFESKQQGVEHVLDAVKIAFAGRKIAVWQTSGTLATVEQARANWRLTAASNWHALATFAARYCPDGYGILVDVGSTTADILPLGQGQPLATGRNDYERLRAGELLYFGVERTPVCAVIPWQDPWQDGTHQEAIPVAAELFATVMDAYIVLGDLPESVHDRETADGRPRTVAHCRQRLCRMVCADAGEIPESQATHLAERIRKAQSLRLSHGIQRIAARLPGPLQAIILAGAGEFLIQHALSQSPGLSAVKRLSLRDMLGERCSQAACAHALAVLAREYAAP
jgi:probable H4MPT-linked C1 transfer pathway protein